MEDWLTNLALPLAVLVGVCWVAHWWGTRIREVERSDIEMKQMGRTSAQYERIEWLKTLLGEKA